jgi:hypothetical protein
LTIPTPSVEPWKPFLASDEVPPPSLREVVQRVGQTYANLRQHLPELSRVISARYRTYQELQSVRTRARLREEVRQAAIYLHQQGHYPVPTGSPTSSAAPVPPEA